MTRAVFLLSEIKLHDDLLCSLLLGAVIGDGQSAVASNIANTTYRLQWWDFTKYDLPEISNCEWTDIVEVVDWLGWSICWGGTRNLGLLIKICPTFLSIFHSSVGIVSDPSPALTAIL